MSQSKISTNENIFLSRLPQESRSHSSFKKRYAWHFSQIIFLLIITIGYAILGTAFVKIPKDWQWILALSTPFIKDFFSKLLFKAGSKARGNMSTGKRPLKFFTGHYVSSKHSVVLAIIIGGVATLLSSLCIMGSDFAKATYAGWKIVQKYKKGHNVEGKSLHKSKYNC